jgi:hypothetical protein
VTVSGMQGSRQRVGHADSRGIGGGAGALCEAGPEAKVVTKLQYLELEQVFFAVYERDGLKAALEAHANAAILTASGRKRPCAVPDSIVMPEIREACELYGVTPARFLEHNRNQTIGKCRDVAALAMRLGGRSYPVIAKIVDRDHSTVIFQVRRAKASDELRAQAEAIHVKLCVADERNEAA